MRTRHARRIAFGLVVGTACASGCMLLIDDELGSIACLDEGAYGPPACPERHACVEGLCAERPVPAPSLGSSCESDAQCNEGDFCLDPTAVGAEGGGVCSRTCCSSIDCDEGGADAGSAAQRSVCWVPAIGGGSFCREASALGREQIGELKAGDKCMTDVECRSGACRQERCADACCSDTNCDLTSSRCVASDGLASEGAAWACAPTPVATKGYLEGCTSDDECISGLCIKLADTLVCSQPCCDSASCGPIDVAGISGQVACVHLPRHGSLVSACARVLPLTAELPVGAPCMTDVECRSGACLRASPVEEDRYCSDLCCVDADCGDPTLVCRPGVFGDTTKALRCTLK